QIPSSILNQLREDLHLAVARCDALRQRNGLAPEAIAAGASSAHHLVGYEASFMRFLADLPLADWIERYIQSPFILNSFGGAFNRGGPVPSYLRHIHRDTKIFNRDAPSMVNMLIMLNDFTLDNGATY